MITIIGYEFEGPYTSSSYLKNESGVYAVLSENDTKIIYVGESDDIKNRVEKNHHKKDCWNKNSFSGFAAKYVNEDSREKIEKEIIEKCNPKCNA